MSEAHRICVCGRQRGKEPVVITITTCKNKHYINTEGPVCLSPDLDAPELDASSSASPSGQSDTQGNGKANTAQPANDKNEKILPAKSEQAALSSDTIPLVKGEGEQDKAAIVKQEWINAEDETLTTPKEDVVDGEEPNVKEEPPDVLDENDQPKVETPDANTQVPNGKADVLEESQSGRSSQDQSDYDAEEPPTEQSPEDADNDNEDASHEQSKDKETTVLMITEIGVNTLPFSDRFFWSKDILDSKISKPNTSDCTLELVVFENHRVGCRHNLKHLNEDNSVIDGEYLIGACGKISIPTDEDIEGRSTKIARITGDYRSDTETNINPYQNVLKSLQSYFSSKKMLYTVNRKTSPIVNMTRYISLGDEIDRRTSEMKDSYEKNARNRSLQTGNTYISNKRTPKWYDGFLMCFGLKSETSLGSGVSDDHDLDSSYLVRRYLRI